MRTTTRRVGKPQKQRLRDSNAEAKERGARSRTEFWRRRWTRNASPAGHGEAGPSFPLAGPELRHPPPHSRWDSTRARRGPRAGPWHREVAPAVSGRRGGEARGRATRDGLPRAGLPGGQSRLSPGPATCWGHNSGAGNSSSEDGTPTRTLKCISPGGGRERTRTVNSRNHARVSRSLSQEASGLSRLHEDSQGRGPQYVCVGERARVSVRACVNVYLCMSVHTCVI